MTIEMAGHEHSGTALICWTLTTQTVDLTVLVHLRLRRQVSPSYPDAESIQ